MKTSYYLRNNPVLVMGVIETALQDSGSADIGRVAALLPLLLDEKMVDTLLDSRLQYSFRQLVQQNNMYLANYNDRYLSLLHPLYHALTIMMDADVVRVNGSRIEVSAREYIGLATASDSDRMKRVSKATTRLFQLAERETNKELYQLLKVAL